MSCEIDSSKDTLEKTITDVTDFAAKLSPSLLTLKHKFHIFLHLPSHIRRFGPALLFSTERYESFNHIFRLCSIHSNRQAPSRDIATAFAHQARCRHIVTGGYWKEPGTERWVCASHGVLQHLENTPLDAHLLGVAKEKPVEVGQTTVRRSEGAARMAGLSWHETQSGVECPDARITETKWFKAETVVTRSGDIARIGSEVIVAGIANTEAAVGSSVRSLLIHLNCLRTLRWTI